MLKFILPYALNIPLCFKVTLYNYTMTFCVETLNQ